MASKRTFKQKGGPPKYVAKEFRKGGKVREIRTLTHREDPSQHLQFPDGPPELHHPLVQDPEAATSAPSPQDEHVIQDVQGSEPSRRHREHHTLLSRWASVRSLGHETLAYSRFGMDHSHHCQICFTCFVEDPLEGMTDEREDGVEENAECASIMPFVRCPECCIDYCTACFEERHHGHLNNNDNKPFHLPEIWNNQTHTFDPYDYTREMTNNHHIKFCKLDSQIVVQHQLLVVDKCGKLFQCTVNLCKCCNIVAQLLEMGYWPGSPVLPTTAFDMDFMKTLEWMMLEGHVSLLAMCEAYKWRNGWTTKECKSIYRKLVAECFEEFRHFGFQVRHHEDEILGDISTDCPVCCTTQNSLYISLDGNMGLVRKKNAGHGYGALPKHGERLFCSDDEVSTFVNTYNDDVSGQRTTCSNFIAGNLLPSKQALDKSGVFGSICRHGIPKYFINMKFGERFAYPVFVIEKLLRDLSSKPLVAMYDVACKLKTHLQKKDRQDILQQIVFAVPCWHAYGHIPSCQVKCSTRWKKNMGLTDGEEMERLWSYLRPFAHITKEMTPSHRVDLLTDALVHYADKKREGMAKQLQKQHNKAIETKTEGEVQLKKICDEGGFEKSRVRKWRRKMKRVVLASPTSKENRNQDWQLDYVDKIQRCTQARYCLTNCTDTERIVILETQLQKLESSKTDIENKHKIQSPWTETEVEFLEWLGKKEDLRKRSILLKIHGLVVDHAFQKGLLRKHTDGGKVNLRVSKQLTKLSSEIKKKVSKYNLECFETERTFPRELTFNIFNTEHQIYQSLEMDALTAIDPEVPVNIKHAAVKQYNIIDRSEEEESIVVEEKEALLEYFTKKRQVLKEYLEGQDQTDLTVAVIQANTQVQMMVKVIEDISKEFSIKDEEISDDEDDIDKFVSRYADNSELYDPDEYISSGEKDDDCDMPEYWL